MWPFNNQVVAFKFLQSGMVPPHPDQYLTVVGGAVVAGTVPIAPNKIARWYVEPFNDPQGSVALRCLGPSGANRYLDAAPGNGNPPGLAPDKSSPTTRWLLISDTIQSLAADPLYVAMNYLVSPGSVMLLYGGGATNNYTCLFYPPLAPQTLLIGSAVTVRPYVSDGSGADLYANGVVPGSNQFAVQLQHGNQSLAQFWMVSDLQDGTVGLRCAGRVTPPYTFLDAHTGDGTVSLAPFTGGIYTGTHWALAQDPAAPPVGNDAVFTLTNQATYLLAPPRVPPQDGDYLKLDSAPHDWIVAVVAGRALTSYTVPNETIIRQGSDNCIYRFARVNGTWTPTNLSTAPKTPPASPNSAVTSYTAGDGQHVAFITTYNTVGHLRSDGTYKDLGGSVRADSPLSSYLAEGNVHSIIFVGTNDHVWQITGDGSTWNSPVDLSKQAGALATVAPASALTSYKGNKNVQGIAYIGNDGHLLQLSFDGSWHPNDLTQTAGAAMPAPGSGLASYVADDAWVYQSIVYLAQSTDGNTHVCQVIYGDHWQYWDLTSQSGGDVTAAPASALSSYRVSGNTQVVSYRGLDTFPHQLVHVEGANWQDSGAITVGSGGLPGPGTGITAYAGPSSDRQRVVAYIGLTGDLCDSYYDGTTWHAEDLTTGVSPR
jgi:hypothetical protein